MNLSNALEKAKQAYTDRPNIYGADYLSWALYKTGDYMEAKKYNKEALRLGENDPIILFHQGLIALKNNDMVLAKKYLSESQKINPNFSILQKDFLIKTLKDIK